MSRALEPRVLAWARWASAQQREALPAGARAGRAGHAGGGRAAEACAWPTAVVTVAVPPTLCAAAVAAAAAGAPVSVYAVDVTVRTARDVAAQLFAAVAAAAASTLPVVVVVGDALFAPLADAAAAVVRRTLQESRKDARCRGDAVRVVTVAGVTAEFGGIGQTAPGRARNAPSKASAPLFLPASDDGGVHVVFRPTPLARLDAVRAHLFRWADETVFSTTLSADTPSFYAVAAHVVGTCRGSIVAPTPAALTAAGATVLVLVDAAAWLAACGGDMTSPLETVTHVLTGLGADEGTTKELAFLFPRATIEPGFGFAASVPTDAVRLVLADAGLTLPVADEADRELRLATAAAVPKVSAALRTRLAIAVTEGKASGNASAAASRGPLGVLAGAAAVHGERTAVVSRAGTMTWSAVHAAVRRLAARLTLPQGASVAVCLGGAAYGPMHVAAPLAAAAAGAANVVLIDTDVEALGIAVQLERARPAAVIVDAATRPLAALVRARHGERTVIVDVDIEADAEKEGHEADVEMETELAGGASARFVHFLYPTDVDDVDGQVHTVWTGEPETVRAKGADLVLAGRDVFFDADDVFVYTGRASVAGVLALVVGLAAAGGCLADCVPADIGDDAVVTVLEDDVPAAVAVADVTRVLVARTPSAAAAERLANVYPTARLVTFEEAQTATRAARKQRRAASTAAGANDADAAAAENEARPKWDGEFHMSKSLKRPDELRKMHRSLANEELMIKRAEEAALQALIAEMDLESVVGTGKAPRAVLPSIDKTSVTPSLKRATSSSAASAAFPVREKKAPEASPGAGTRRKSTAAGELRKVKASPARSPKPSEAASKKPVREPRPGWGVSPVKKRESKVSISVDVIDAAGDMPTDASRDRGRSSSSDPLSPPRVLVSHDAQHASDHGGSGSDLDRRPGDRERQKGDQLPSLVKRPARSKADGERRGTSSSENEATTPTRLSLAEPAHLDQPLAGEPSSPSSLLATVPAGGSRSMSTLEKRKKQGTTAGPLSKSISLPSATAASPTTPTTASPSGRVLRDGETRRVVRSPALPPAFDGKASKQKPAGTVPRSLRDGASVDGPEADFVDFLREHEDDVVHLLDAVPGLSIDDDGRFQYAGAAVPASQTKKPAKAAEAHGAQPARRLEEMYDSAVVRKRDARKRLGTGSSVDAADPMDLDQWLK